MSSSPLQKRTFAESFIRFFERWTPNSMVIAYALTAIVAVLALILTPTPFFSLERAGRDAAVAYSIVEAWGMGFWSLLELAMQMALILITGSVIASSPPVRRFLQKVARVPNSMGQAVLLTLLVVPIVNWFHFGLGIMLGIQLGRQIVLAARQKGYKMHHPLFVSLLYALNISGIGISQIAPILGASPGALHRLLFPHNPYVSVSTGPGTYAYVPIHDVLPYSVPLTNSAFLIQNIIMCVVVLAVVFAVMWMLKPKKESAIMDAPDALIAEIEAQNKIGMAKPSITSPAGMLDNSIIPSLVLGGFGLLWVVWFFAADGQLNFNNFNMLMIIIGVLLCGSPNQFIKSVQASIAATWGIIIQFPFYAGIFGLLAFTGLNDVIVGFFRAFATEGNWPFISYVYTSIVNIAVPSGGPKFFLVAPHALEVAAGFAQACADTGAISDNSRYIGTMLISYVAGDVSTNGFLPFWALPYLAMFKLDFRQMLPFTAFGSIAAYVVFTIFLLFVF